MNRLFENWRNYLNDDRLDESVVRDILQNVDDLLDQTIQEAAPEIVRSIREREVDEDVDEFIDGALHGGWESKTQAYADPPNIGDPVEVMDEGDNPEVTEMYRLGYEWGWKNPDKASEDIPPDVKRQMVEEAIGEFQERISEEVLIDALEKSVDWAKHSLDDVHTVLKNAKDKFGWKLVPAIAGIEVFEHAILPQLLVTLTGNPAFYVVATIPTIEILAATALAIAKSKLPKQPEPEPEPGHLDWYEDEGHAANLFENWRKYLNEEVKFSGILKLNPNADAIMKAKSIMQTLPPEAVPLSDERLHVTLAHQSVLKPYRKQLKALTFPPEPEVLLSSEWEEKVDEALGRKSWSVMVENQEELRTYVNQIMELAGAPLDPEPDRVFHISLANLTGNPGDSVR